MWLGRCCRWWRSIPREQRGVDGHKSLRTALISTQVLSAHYRLVNRDSRPYQFPLQRNFSRQLLRRWEGEWLDWTGFGPVPATKPRGEEDRQEDQSWDQHWSECHRVTQGIWKFLAEQIGDKEREGCEGDAKGLSEKGQLWEAGERPPCGWRGFLQGGHAAAGMKCRSEIKIQTLK